MTPGASHLLPALLLGAVATAAVAQPPAPPTPVFGEVVEVRVINLEVVVTDRDGLPVTGLPAGDFRLLVDGEEVPVRYFTEVRGGQAIESGGAEAGAALAGIPDLVPGSPVGTSYLVFVDDFFSIARDRDRVLKALADDLSRLGPEDRMAVVAYDGNDLEMLSTWSSSVPELDRALQKAVKRPAHGLRRDSERRSFISGSRRMGQPGITGLRGQVANRLEMDERFYAELLEDQLRNTVSAASAALRGFANPPGRKVMLLMSGGWPYDIPEFVTREFGRAILEPQVERGNRLFAPLVESANRLGYTLYAVDVPGLATESVIDASNSERPVETEQFGSFVRENNTQYTLEYVSQQTGGRALINAGRTAALERAAADTRTYYWLGFVPSWQGDDRAHKVDVQVRRDGLRVRSRAGYLDSSRSREVSMAVESALMFGGGPNLRPLALAVSEPSKASVGTMRVNLELSVPASELTLLPVGRQRVAELELRVAAIDDRGGRSEIPVLPVRLVVDTDPAPGQRVSYRTTLELRRAHNRVAVALYDPAAGTIWSTTVDVEP
jgi:VWFA-related protein